MGQNLLQKQCKFPIYLREFEETGQVDEVVLWVLLWIMWEPIAILLKGEFWIMTEEEDIGDVQMLFVYQRGRAFHPHSLHDQQRDARHCTRLLIFQCLYLLCKINIIIILLVS